MNDDNNFFLICNDFIYFFAECPYEFAVRRLFVFLKERLEFETLQNGLIQRNLLQGKEEEDYVYKDRGKLLRNERLIKLTIKKNRCKEFVAFISEKPCHKHIADEIAKVQKKDEETHSVQKSNLIKLKLLNAKVF